MGLFGISQREAWKQFCQETTPAAVYVKSSSWSGERVEMAFQNWNIVLDTFVIPIGAVMMPYTRIRTLYMIADDFVFGIYKKGFLAGMSKAYGAKRVETGNRLIDEKFDTKSNDEDKIRQLFANERFIELILLQPQMEFGAKRHKKNDSNTGELCFQVEDIIKDVERLKQLFELFGETLITLNEMGIVSENASPITLK